MNTHSKLLSTPDEIFALANSLRGQSVIALDTEFIRETTFFPVVEILQIATDENSWLVDAHAFKKGFPPGPRGSYAASFKPILDVFGDRKILKILHAAQGDQECLYTSFGVVASPSLDTSVAASLCGYGDAIGLGKLLKQVLGIEIKKGHARTNWSARPLPTQLASYALADVQHLVALGNKLLEELDRLGRKAWAMELSSKWEDRSLYEPDYEALAAKLARSGKLDRKGYAALVELVKWRENRVRTLNLPRRWVADDTVLLDLANVRPKDMEHLATFRGLNKGELRNSGEAILEALRHVSPTGGVIVSRATKPDIPTGEESQALDLLRCYIGILADQHRIATKHLMTSSQLLPLLRMLREPNQTTADIVKAGLLSEDAGRLIGEELIALVRGKRALTVFDGGVRIINLGE